MSVSLGRHRNRHVGVREAWWEQECIPNTRVMDVITIDKVQRLDEDEQEIAIVKLYFQPWKAVPTGDGYSEPVNMFCMSLDDFRNGLQSQENMCVAGIRPEVRDNVVSAVDGGHNVNKNGIIFYPNRALGCYKKLNIGDSGYRYVLYDVDIESRPILFGLNQQLFEEAGDKELKIKRVLSHTDKKQGIYATLRPIHTDVRAYNEREEAGVGDTHGQPDIHTFWGVVDVQIDKKRDIEDGPYVFTSTEELREAVNLYLNFRRSTANEAKEKYGEMNTWDVSNVKDMSDLFRDRSSFNEDISRWDVGNVESMKGMFCDCSSFDANLSEWNVKNVKYMDKMFEDCHKFNSNLSKWNVESAKTMDNMFYGCEAFNSNLSQWKVNKVESMDSMFFGCEAFTSDLSQWDVESVETMRRMFCGCTEFTSDLSRWKVNNVKNMTFMFYACEEFTSDLSQWNVNEVKNMRSMFGGCTEFTSDLSKWKVNNVKDMEGMFYNCKKFTSDLSQWKVYNVEDMSSMFYGCESFTSDLSQWNVDKVTDMTHMFMGCKKFNSDLSRWNVTKCYSMSGMFDGTAMDDIPEWYR